MGNKSLMEGSGKCALSCPEGMTKVYKLNNENVCGEACIKNSMVGVLCWMKKDTNDCKDGNDC